MNYKDYKIVRHVGHAMTEAAKFESGTVYLAIRNGHLTPAEVIANTPGMTSQKFSDQVRVPVKAGLLFRGQHRRYSINFTRINSLLALSDRLSFIDNRNLPMQHRGEWLMEIGNPNMFALLIWLTEQAFQKSVTEITREFNLWRMSTIPGSKALAQSEISKRLAILSSLGAVRFKRDGVFRFYLLSKRFEIEFPNIVELVCAAASVKAFAYISENA